MATEPTVLTAELRIEVQEFYFRYAECLDGGRLQHWPEFFLDACEDHLRASLKMRRTASGIQLVGLLAPGLDDRAIAARARAEGVNVSPLSMQYRHGKGEHGLVMGFAAADERTTLRAIRKLAAILDSSS